MSAMHWEARRRQAVLDRRSRSKQVQQDPPLPNPKEQNNLQEPVQPSPARGCVHCMAEPSGDVRHTGAKIDNRYNSIQYTQQW